MTLFICGLILFAISIRECFNSPDSGAHDVSIIYLMLTGLVLAIGGVVELVVR